MKKHQGTAGGKDYKEPPLPYHDKNYKRAALKQEQFRRFKQLILGLGNEAIKNLPTVKQNQLRRILAAIKNFNVFFCDACGKQYEYERNINYPTLNICKSCDEKL